MKWICFLLTTWLFVTGHIVIAQPVSSTSLALAAEGIQNKNIIYDPAYYSISYPMGDIPSDKGVCTDVVIRAFRKINIDLQSLVHEDMTTNFESYPPNWGLKKPDKNIDHRRVPNLMHFFSKYGTVKPESMDVEVYKPGDIVCWDLGSGVTHIGILTTKKSKDGQRFLVMHNIGAGQVLEDCLFDFTIIGHYSYPK